MNNRIFLVQFKLEYKAPPLGLLYIADALEKSGFAVKLFYVNSNEVENVSRQILAEKPLFAGLSCFTSHALKPSILLSKMIKKSNQRIPIVWGGIHASLFPEECLNEDYIDMVVIGEGEKNIVRLAENLKFCRSLENIEGIGYKVGKKQFITPAGVFYDNLDEYEPAWKHINLEDCLKEDFGRKRVISLITSRGCPFNCAFCWNINFYKRRWRGISARKIIEQINHLKKNHKIDGVIFEDSNFLIDKKKVFQIVHNIMIDWGASVRAEALNDEVMAVFKENGCKFLFVGAESGSQKMLDLMHKDIKVKDIINAARLCEKYDIIGRFSFMAGFPGETESDLFNTMDLITQLVDKYKRVKIFGPKLFTPYPGTEFYEKAIELGFKPPAELKNWADFTRNRCHLPWVKNKAAIESLQFINMLAHNYPKGIMGGLVKKIEEYRWKNKFLLFPFEIKLVSFLHANQRVNRLLTKIYGDDGTGKE